MKQAFRGIVALAFTQALASSMPLVGTEFARRGRLTRTVRLFGGCTSLYLHLPMRGRV
jgi:hypothetical protein